MNTLYTMDGCVRCYKAVNHLTDQHISFIEINVLENPLAAMEIKRITGEVVLPVLICESRVLKGEEILFMKNE
ncbi:glutaredoxin family protein [Bacillus timonensis]|nr:glutaredoxin family protein [Bacillus timonensis]